MTIRKVRLTLEASDHSLTEVEATLQEFNTGDRLRRAATVMLVAIVLAATLIPIPIVHLVGIPLMLIFGVVLAARQLRITCRLKPVRLACPRCQGVNRVGGGLGVRDYAEPTEWSCENCRRTLLLKVAPE